MFNIFYALKWRQKELKHLLLINLSYILNTQTNFKKPCIHLCFLACLLQLLQLNISPQKIFLAIIFKIKTVTMYLYFFACLILKQLSFTY